MNRQKTIALFAAFAAVAMTTVSLTGVSATPLLVSSIPQTHEGMTMLGHVEYTLMDPDNQIKRYIQGDNSVVDDGKDCVSRAVFGVAQGGGDCGTTGDFTFIAIGNGTTGSAIPTFSNLHQLTNNTSDGCADASGLGEMARKSAVVTISSLANSGGSVGAKIELDTSADPFQFDTTNATTVEQSGIFNADILTPGSNGICSAAGTFGSTWNMFSIQELNSANGIDVTDGDSLAVKWTITVG